MGQPGVGLRVGVRPGKGVRSTRVRIVWTSLSYVLWDHGVGVCSHLGGFFFKSRHCELSCGDRYCGRVQTVVKKREGRNIGLDSETN